MGGVVVICYVGGLGAFIGGTYNSISRMWAAEGFWNIILEGFIGMILGSISGGFIFTFIFLAFILAEVGKQKYEAYKKDRDNAKLLLENKE
jgi:uncharacterized membrane protein HdeD (DUF308 family)